jgi:energy-coupling factor transporter ATP-binding protein EcfA2
MNLLSDILNWTGSLPDWQRDACRRLFQNENGLKADDYAELYSLLKKEKGIEVDSVAPSVPLASEHLPAGIAAGETVTLVALRNLEHVNQISHGHVLPFSETGMTVIYGGNGSGKSGYARVMKRACRARDQSEPVHPDANDPDAALRVPSAKFDVKVDGTAEEIAWSCDATPPDRLSTISVFDAKCARSYVTSEKDVAYLPYGLDVVEGLANKVLPRIGEMLEAEIKDINVDTLPFQHLHGETVVGKAIQDLSAKSDADAIATLGTPTADDQDRIAKLESALRLADPLSRAKELAFSVRRLKTYADQLVKPLSWVSAEAVEKLVALVNDQEIAEAAEAKAADSLRSGEQLLPGTGDQAWKRLFEAARRYATEAAYPGDAFPPVDEGKACPLCQNDLGETGTQRLKRFEEYVKKDVAKTADDARKIIGGARNKIEAAELQIVPQEALSDELQALDDSVLDDVEKFQSCIDSRRAWMLEFLETREWVEVPKIAESPRARIRGIAAKQLKAYRTLVRAADVGKREKLESELKELAARRSLSKSLKAVLELLERMRRRAYLEKCRAGLKTRPISNKAKEFATIAVTDELRKALDREFSALGVGHIKTKLKEKPVRGKILHQLLLDLPTSNKTDEILSEGEQRAIALGSFFAELALANHSCGIVFDDPVSSLDHWRRRNVARRLVEEARVRQVVVFTHDTSFLGQLCDEIEAASIPNSKSFLEWQEGRPGCVKSGLPWDHQGYKARIDALEKAQSKLAKTWPVYPGEKEIHQMRDQYDGLRATLERVIQDLVFNGVIQRYRDWIRVNLLDGVVGFTQSECEAIAKLHKRCCDVVSAHDPSSAKAAAVPTAAELKDNIAALKSVVEAINDRRNGK